MMLVSEWSLENEIEDTHKVGEVRHLGHCIAHTELEGYVGQ